MSPKSTVTGLAVALVIGGGGGGVVLGPLSAMGARASNVAPANPAPERFEVADVRGEVEVLVANGVWRRTRAGDVLSRPTAIRTRGPEGRATLTLDGVRLVVGQEAILLVGGRSDLVLELGAGHLLARAAQGSVRVAVPAHQAHVSGPAFGVWSRPEALVAAVLDGQLTLENDAGLSKQYAKGREVTITARGDVPVPMAPRLELELVSVVQRGRRFAIRGKTAPSTVLLHRVDATVTRVPVIADGSFSLESETRDPPPGTLVAYDAAGRSAELSRPSATLDAVLESLGGAATGESAPAVEAPPTPAEPKAALPVAPPTRAEAARRVAPTEAPAAPKAAPRPAQAAAEVEARAAALEPAAAKAPEPPKAETAASDPKGENDKPKRAKSAPAAKDDEGSGRGHAPAAVPVDLFPKSGSEAPAPPPPPAPKPKKRDEGKKGDDGVELQWE